MELLRPQDVFFLHVETPRVQQHVTGVALIDPRLPDGGRLGVEDLVRAVAERLDRLPRFRQRLAFPALGLARPAWVDAEDFDVHFHVRGATVAPPGGPQELADLVGRLLSRHMDRTRPLWEVYLVDGLEGDRVAFIIKLHHAIADGLGGISVARTLLDNTAQMATFPQTTWHPSSPPSAWRLFGATLREQVLAPLRLVSGAVRGAVETPGPSFRQAGAIVAGLWALARAGTAPPSPLNRSVGPTRRFAPVVVDLAKARSVRLAFGASPSDVVLATIGGALQRYFHERGETLAASSLRAMVPVSVRAQGRHGVPGNWTTAYSLPLSLEPMAGEARLAAVVAANRVRKRSHEPAAARFAMNVVGTWLPRPLHALAARLMYRGKWFNLIVSTMPGSPRAMYLAGARLDIAYPILPLAEGVGLTVGAMTWEGRLAFGLTADAGIVPDLDRLAAAVADSFDELVAAADRTRAAWGDDSDAAVSEDRRRAPAAEGH